MSTAARISLFYVTLYTPMAVHVPFMSLWYEARGISPSELGAIGFLMIVARVVTGPWFGSWVDRHGHARRLTIALSWATALAFAANLLSDRFWPLLAIAIAYSIVRSPMTPLGDAITLAAARRENFEYGHVRVWGSVGFLLSTLAAGPLLAAHSADTTIAIGTAFFVLAALGAHALPHDPPAPRGERPRAPVRNLLRQPVFMLFLATVSLLQAGHGVLYGYSSLHWRDVGLTRSEIGWLWSMSTLAEIALFWFARPVVARVGPARLLLISALATILRWSLSAHATSFWSFAALQLLHTGTFGICYLGAMYFIAQQLPASHAASAQTLHAGATSLLLGLAMWATGPVYAAHGPAAYYVVASFGVLALFLGLALLRERGGAAG